MVILHSPRCLDYAAAGHPESPERVRSAVAQLQKGSHKWLSPTPCTNEDILRVHTRELLTTVCLGTFDDADTPVFPEIFDLAKLSAVLPLAPLNKHWLDSLLSRSCVLLVITQNGIVLWDSVTSITSRLPSRGH